MATEPHRCTVTLISIRHLYLHLVFTACAWETFSIRRLENWPGTKLQGTQAYLASIQIAYRWQGTCHLIAAGRLLSHFCVCFYGSFLSTTNVAIVWFFFFFFYDCLDF